MEGRYRFHVVPDGDVWKLVQQSDRTTRLTATTRRELETLGSKLAAEFGGQLFIHGADGEIEQERCFPNPSAAAEKGTNP